ncbi:uncharacterized protein LOC124168740 [Ischnura elegans]|uniref:uncharacterized protein LOC124168740 n=1 Tax=Ischnura elegans TaxID=197161 RepID=UPI001ED87995|nr:uncharacterized protein LOC124168740 [Ischnura elegans]
MPCTDASVDLPTTTSSLDVGETSVAPPPSAGGVATILEMEYGEGDRYNATGEESLASDGSEHNAVVFLAENTGATYNEGPQAASSRVHPHHQVRSRRPQRHPPIIEDHDDDEEDDEEVDSLEGEDIEDDDDEEGGEGDEDGADWRLGHSASLNSWDRGNRRRFNNTRVQHIEAECQDDYMKIRIGFNGSFTGLLYSSGYSYDPDCVYINGTGRDYYEFFIQLNRCGTLGKNNHNQDSRKNPTKNYMWNTVTVQYNSVIEEEWDEHFKVTCEYGYDFWKTVTFPFLDVEVATGNPVVFTLSPPECYMEIRHGYGTSGARVGGPVRVGDPLTLLIYMRSKYDGFDLVVNDCFAHNGANKKIQLIDQYGCPVDEKLISRFRGSWSEGGVFETQVFAYMKTFRFTGSPALYIECDVRMCHGRCPSQPCHWRNAKGSRRRRRRSSGAHTLTAVVSSSTQTSSPAIIAPTTQGESTAVSSALASTASPSLSSTAPPEGALSENLSLFQSLRVLQEGEDGDDGPVGGGGKRDNGRLSPADPNNVCLKTGAFTAVLGFASLFTAVLCVAVAILACRLRRMRRRPSHCVDHSQRID